MHPKRGEHLRDAHERSLQREAQPEVVIAVLAILRAPLACPLERLPAEERARSRVADELRHHVLVSEVGRANAPHHRAVRVHEIEIAVDQHCVGLPRQLATDVDTALGASMSSALR